MKRVLVALVCFAAVAGAVVTGTTRQDDIEFAPHGAIVLNWGVGQGGRYTCGATCGGGVVCVVNGKLALHVNNSGAGLSCTDADWILAPPKSTAHYGLNCGFYGVGKGVLTPSANFNFYCNT